MADTIRTKRGTTSAWNAANPVLALGEQGYDTTTKQMKIGDGVTAWNSLAYLDISATNLTTGTLPDARLSAKVKSLADLATPASTSLLAMNASGALVAGESVGMNTEAAGVTVLDIGLATSGWPSFKHILQSIANDGAPGTFNHIYAIGLNTSVESFHGNTIPGKPTAILAFESNYPDVDGLGPEMYMEFANLQRPFYARSIFDPATTTIAAGSNGASLPQSTINVASTTKFPQYGWIKIGSNTIEYTGKTSTSFTGCTGGTGSLATGNAVESLFRDNSTVHIDIGTDGQGSFSLFAGKLNPSKLAYAPQSGGFFFRDNVSLQSGGVLVLSAASIPVLNANGSSYSPARRYYSEDFAGDSTITITADFVDVFRARITTSGTPIFAAPTNPTTGQELTIILSNRFGGTTISGPTWDAVFKMAAWGTNPSPGANRKITFVYDGTNWTEISRSELIAN